MILSVGFHKVDEFIRVCDGTRDSVLFGPEKYNASYNRIQYLINQKGGITYVFYHNYEITETYSCHSVLLKKTLPLHNFVTT